MSRQDLYDFNVNGSQVEMEFSNLENGEITWKVVGDFGSVISGLYNVTYTGLEKAIKETERRRTIQIAYNKEHNITPTTIKKEIRDVIKNTDTSKNKEISKAYNKKDKQKMMEKIEKEMMEAAKELDFERATELRDILFEMKME